MPLRSQSTALPTLTLITQTVVATILLKYREWKWPKLLWAILIVSVICAGITIVLVSVFSSGDQAVFDWLALIWLAIWLAYFFASTRVKRVFFSKDWSADVSPMSINRAPVATAAPPPVQIPSVTPNTATPSFEASKPNASRRRDARQQSRSFAGWNQSLRRSPDSSRFC